MRFQGNHRVVVYSEVHAHQKAMYDQLVLQHHIKASREYDGYYVANIRLQTKPRNNNTTLKSPPPPYENNNNTVEKEIIALEKKINTYKEISDKKISSPRRRNSQAETASTRNKIRSIAIIPNNNKTSRPRKKGQKVHSTKKKKQQSGTPRKSKAVKNVSTKNVLLPSTSTPLPAPPPLPINGIPTPSSISTPISVWKSSTPPLKKGPPKTKTSKTKSKTETKPADFLEQV